MTFLDLQNEAAVKCKISMNDPVLVTFIKNEINKAYYTLARNKKIPELLVVNQYITTTDVAAIGYATLSSDFIVEDRVQVVSLIQAPNDYKTWDLAARQTAPIPPAAIFGKPKCYTITRNELTLSSDILFNIYLEPKDAWDPITDSLKVDYYSIPDPLNSDSDILLSARWNDEIVDQVALAFAIRDNKTEQAKLFAAPAPQQSTGNYRV